MILHIVMTIKFQNSIGSACRPLWGRSLIAALVLFLCLNLPAAARSFDEYQLKAVFLYRLSLFIKWPPKAFTAVDQPFVIGIVGDDPFGTQIDRVVENEKVGQRSIEIKRYPTLEDIHNASCQILFIGQSITGQWSELKQHLHGRPILTVSDSTDFARTGGMVNIQTQNHRIKIQINPKETRKAGLVVSAKLLKVARQVTSHPEGDRR